MENKDRGLCVRKKSVVDVVENGAFSGHQVSAAQTLQGELIGTERSD